MPRRQTHDQAEQPSEPTCRDLADVGEVVDDLLVAGRAEAGALQVEIAPLCLSAEVASSLESLDFGPERTVEVTLRHARALGDASRIRQITRNLLSNVIRRGGNRISISVSASPDAQQWLVKVADDGPGVPTSLEETLFHPYQHGTRDAGLTESVGLGLYVSRSLAQLMGGDLTYRRDNEQTVFELSLPAARPEGRQAES